jgi:hypothetical protein
VDAAVPNPSHRSQSLLDRVISRADALPRRSMMRQINTRGQHSIQRIALIAILFLGLQAPSASAQAISPSEAMDAYRTIDKWVRDWDIVSTADEDTASEPYSVVSVVIRSEGAVIGRSALASLAPDDQLLWRATRIAIHRAEQTLPTQRDAGWEEERAERIRSMTLAIELGRDLVAFADSELDAPGLGWTPASVGVAVQRGDAVEPMPTDMMLMRGLDLVRSAQSLCVRLTGDGSTALDSAREISDAGFTIYRYTPIAIAQPGAGFGPEFLDRGGRVIQSSEINTRSITQLAEGIASHLRAQRWSGIERYGLMGTLDPITDKHSPTIASAFEQGIAAYALLDYGSLGEDASHQLARQAGREILRDLAILEPGESSVEDDLLGAAACAAALAEISPEIISNSDELRELRELCVEELARAYVQDAGFHPSVPDGARGLIAWGMVRASSMDARVDRDAALGAVRAVFREVPAPQLVSQMPFLGLAEIEAAAEGAIPAGAALDEMRSLVWDHMLRPADLDNWDRDLAGGIVFTSADRPLPSWHSLRPLAFIASMLGDERMTPGTIRESAVAREIAQLVESLRFLRQLSATSPVTHLYPNKSDARWGVRASVWDQSMPIESSALGLMTATQTLRSLREIASRLVPNGSQDQGAKVGE